MAFSGAIDVGRDFHADMTLGLGLRKEQVITVNISEINISKLLRLAGEMIEVQGLQTMNGGEDFLVFRQVKFLFSTGGVILQQRYDRGIHVRGMMEFFGKKGEFDGRVFEDGIRIKGGIDHFNIGGLEIQSARSKGKRATMDIEMTGEKQKIFVDGKISFHAIELSIIIDAYLQKRRLEAEISLKFTESIMLRLKAKAEVPSSQSLEGVVMEFSAELNPDIVGAFFKAINNTIETIGKMASDLSKNIKEDLQRQVYKKQADLDKLKIELELLKQEVDQEVKDRQVKIDQDTQERKELEKELDRLENAVAEAQEKKEDNESKINDLELEKEQIKRRFNKKIRNKQKDYETELKAARENEKNCDKEKKRLEDKKNASFGDILRSKEEADRSWQWWESKSGFSSN
ncbi:hypothetical protein N7462_006533 [Penicillium macrosclerotiorum]|uniref:uncharacterized protein n=1 Tax=Penicillium macrosclerotiorum TaxID=303699 RepID=UPI002549AFCB|nr:uncharacterized protein N7462_006533 [Penicillium macrosclerotiorum]KAJ5683368.1 hypothetical protein N7462_006533 [Penicillium macrosclerotiorum]